MHFLFGEMCVAEKSLFVLFGNVFERPTENLHRHERFERNTESGTK